VDTLDYDAYAEAIDDDTAFVHLETLGNPALVTADLERVSGIAHEAGVPLVVDNTFATPALCRPFEHGADVVWTSSTKWLHGAGTTIGGAVVAGGSFPWRDHDYSEVAGPNPAFHGTDFSERFGDAALAHVVRQRGVRPIGSGQSPFDAWQTLQGLRTLELRMERHSDNALALAEFLEEHPAVEWVSYPGLASHETHDNADRYLEGGYGGMVAFGLDGGYEAGRRFCEAVELSAFAANVGDARTHVIHPASTTHAQLSAEEQLAAGVTPDLVRASFGIEDAADLIADAQRGIEAATGGN
jgi:O-acetylhomoserine (thiol)-lyase